jgi:hypothetical protein
VICDQCGKEPAEFTLYKGQWVLIRYMAKMVNGLLGDKLCRACRSEQAGFEVNDE